MPEIYAGHPSRIQRYYQYDDMDRDSDINAALDTIADFCTQSEEQAKTPFLISYNETPNNTQVKLIQESLRKWVKLNSFNSRLWFIFREAIKKGDAIFLRDPETQEWDWIDQYMVESVLVRAEDGKVPQQYMIRGLDLNRRAKYATQVADQNLMRTAMNPGNPTGTGGGAGPASFALAGADIRGSNASGSNTELVAVDASNIIHLSMSCGMDINWPFGSSVLFPVYKTFKQKELLEDSLILYRVSRAPERRVFKIDTGDMNSTRSRAYIEQVKNEIHQRRIPNRTGGGSSIMDAAYNPLSANDDYFFAVTAEGRGSSVEVLPGGDSLGEIGDLTFFSKKMARGMKIPSNYLSLGDDESGSGIYNDGKLGAAMIQEFKFNKLCIRIQSLFAEVIDREFKRYLYRSGVEIESSLFDVFFHPPQNFSKYRQIELDTQQVGVYQQISDNRELSVRFKQKRYLGLTDEEMAENEQLWSEENPSKLKKQTGASAAEQTPPDNFASVGVRSPSFDDEPLPQDEFSGDDGEDGGDDNNSGGDNNSFGGINVNNANQTSSDASGSQGAIQPENPTGPLPT